MEHSVLCLEPGKGTWGVNIPLLPPGDKLGLASGGDALDHEVLTCWYLFPSAHPHPAPQSRWEFPTSWLEP